MEVPLKDQGHVAALNRTFNRAPAQQFGKSTALPGLYIQNLEMQQRKGLKNSSASLNKKDQGTDAEEGGIHKTNLLLKIHKAEDRGKDAKYYATTGNFDHSRDLNVSNFATSWQQSAIRPDQTAWVAFPSKRTNK